MAALAVLVFGPASLLFSVLGSWGIGDPLVDTGAVVTPLVASGVLGLIGMWLVRIALRHSAKSLWVLLGLVPVILGLVAQLLD